MRRRRLTEIHVFFVEIVYGLILLRVSVRGQDRASRYHTARVIEQVPLGAVSPPRLHVVRRALQRRYRTYEDVHGSSGRCLLGRLGPLLQIFRSIGVARQIQLPSGRLGELQGTLARNKRRGKKSDMHGEGGGAVGQPVALAEYLPDLVHGPFSDDGVVKQTLRRWKDWFVTGMERLPHILAPVGKVKR